MAKEGLQFEFSASTAEYRKAVESMPRDLQKAADEIEDIGQEINTSMSKAVGRGLVQGLAAGGVVLKLRQVIDHFDQLSDAAKRFGASSEDIQRIDVAAKQSGVSLESVATAMEEAGTKANKAAREGGKFLESFNRSGIDAAAFASAGLAEKIEMVGAAQAAAGGDTQRLSDITEALGNTVGRVDFATMASGMKEVSVLSDGMVDALSRANDQMQSFDRGLNLAVGFSLGLLGEAFQRATSAAIALGTQDFSIFGKNIEELKAMSEGLPPLFDKTAMSVEGASESTVNYSEVLQKLISVNTEMEASMARMEKGAGALGAQLAEAELRLSQLSQEFAQSGDADVFKEIEKTAKEILSLRQQTAREEEKIRKETAETSAEYRKQADSQARAISSIEEEVNLLQAKLSGNKDLTAELERQQDFNEAREKTGRSNVGLADQLAGLRAEERRREEEEGDARAKHAPRGGGSSRPTPPTRDQTVAQMRADAARERATRRVGEFMDRGAFGSAAAAMERGDRRANDILQDQRARDVMGDLFGAKNIGDSLRNFERDSRKAGMTPDEALKRMGIDREVGEDRADALKRFVDEQAKTPEERKAEEEAMRDKHAPKGGGGKESALEGLVSTIKGLCSSINDKLPQHALVPG